MLSKKYKTDSFAKRLSAKFLTFAIILLTALAGVPEARAQSLDHLSNAYVTPFPSENRYRLYVFGDSLGDGIWAGLYRAFSTDGNVDVIKKSRVSTGFVRTDYFNWNKRLRDVLAAEKVHIAVAMFGANDMQPIRVNKKWHKVGSPGWREIYGKRVDTFIKKLKTSRTAVYWVGLPIMRTKKQNAAMEVMNEIFRERAFVNGVKFVDTWNGFADQFGRYSAFGPDLNGQMGRLRANDGVHFTIRGYRKLAHFVEREIRRDMRQARSERDIPLAGSETEQARAIRRPIGKKQRVVKRAPAKPVARKPKKKVILTTPRQKQIEQKRAAQIRELAPLENKVAIPEATATVAGIKILRPAISQAAVAVIGKRYTPHGEVIAAETNAGVTAMASISPISESDLIAAQRRLPVTQRPYYRVLVRGEEQTPKPGRADDFTWKNKGS